jgi:hypothetical protein
MNQPLPKYSVNDLVTIVKCPEPYEPVPTNLIGKIAKIETIDYYDKFDSKGSPEGFMTWWYVVMADDYGRTNVIEEDLELMFSV